jgi:D-proline reductase (dithiol) PrdB
MMARLWEREDMTAPSDDQSGFASDDDAPIPYMARTREYYAAIGYTTP